jgi:hypothetical protein
MRADQSWLAGKVTCTLQHSLLNRQLHAVRYIACRKTAYMRQRCLQQGNIDYSCCPAILRTRCTSTLARQPAAQPFTCSGCLSLQLLVSTLAEQTVS